jgi:hypothetical protein
MEYNNRYNDVYTFTKQEDGNVLMEGKFEWMRVGGDFIDPSGGPFIKVGQMLSHIIYDGAAIIGPTVLLLQDEFNVIVESFERVDTGYLIKCKEHEYDPNDTSHLADSKIIGGIINTTGE